ncbi:alpha/beta hydrolase [Serratia nevei]|uniref:alpha/beta hydrolase family protein n=1 Tax=Serratia nevei TaxID=2703794 RepID=UPI003FA7B2E4
MLKRFFTYTHYLVLIMVLTPMAKGLAQQSIPAGKVVDKQILQSAYGLQEAAEQYLIQYSSISGLDDKTLRQDTAAVFIPKGKVPKNGWPVVIWAHGTTGVGKNCAPSLNARTARDSQYLNTWLSLGFAVVAPDYAGLGSKGLHHYMNAKAEAYSVLDSARAALSDFPLQNAFVFVGQSQGAHAAFASAGYQNTYAPELNVLATILTGTPYFNGMTSTQTVFDQPFTDGADPKIPYAFYIYLSAADLDTTLKAETFFQKNALSALRQARNLCISQLSELTQNQKLNMANSLKPDIQKLLNLQIGSMQYPTLHIEHPVFIGIGNNDVNVPTAMQKKFATDVRKAGTLVEIHEYPGLDHSGTVNPSLRDSVPFIMKVMNVSDMSL